MRNTVAILLMVIAATTASAQQLPSIQRNNLRAPATLKIDGKTDDWNKGFQAYNHATDVFYTIANDDDNLYLVVSATSPNIVNRVINGGITLGISPSGKKGNNEIAITYPVYERGTKPTLIINNKKDLDNPSAK